MAVDTFYPGSKLLAPLSDSLGLPVDQVNFLTSQIAALCLGYIFRVHYGPHIATAHARHVFEVMAGMSMVQFIFGYQAMFILTQTLSCFFLMRVLPNKWMPFIVTSFAMLQLSVCHLWRQIYHYRSLTSFDLSIPYMINTQRVTSLAWSLYDGRAKDPNKLSANQRRLAVSKMPSLLEVLSYSLNFHGVIVGPFCFYVDYVNYIEGTNLHCNLAVNGANNNHHASHGSYCPPPTGRVLKRLLMFVVYSIVTLTTFPAFPISYISDAGFLNAGFFSKMNYLLIITAIFRYKYFAVWKLSEAVNNNAGFGFYYDDRGDAKWDLADTANLWEIEFATSFKMLLDNWNMTTGYWLRYLVFERVTKMKTVKVFLLSSLWHGFYPGYYFTAANSALFGIAARFVRIHFRSWFITSQWKHLMYDVITLVTTRIIIGYTCFPFVHLEFFQPLEVYKKLFFSFHIIGIAVIIVLSMRPRPDKKVKKNS